jgi:hypothetical protein
MAFILLMIRTIGKVNRKFIYLIGKYFNLHRRIISINQSSVPYKYSGKYFCTLSCLESGIVVRNEAVVASPKLIPFYGTVLSKQGFGNTNVFAQFWRTELRDVF